MADTGERLEDWMRIEQYPCGTLHFVTEEDDAKREQLRQRARMAQLRFRVSIGGSVENVLGRFDAATDGEDVSQAVEYAKALRDGFEQGVFVPEVPEPETPEAGAAVEPPSLVDQYLEAVRPEVRRWLGRAWRAGAFETPVEEADTGTDLDRVASLLDDSAEQSRERFIREVAGELLAIWQALTSREKVDEQAVKALRVARALAEGASQ